MEIGQYGEQTTLINGEVKKTQIVKLISEDKKEWRFQIENDENYHLTISKNIGLDHTWQVGENGNIKMRSFINVWK